MKTVKRLHPGTIAAINRHISRAETEFKISDYSYSVCGETIRRKPLQGGATEMVLLNRGATLPEGTLFTDRESTVSIFCALENAPETDITKTVLNDLDYTITDSDGAVEIEDIDRLIFDAERWNMSVKGDNVFWVEHTDPYRRRNNAYSRGGVAFDD